MSSDIEILRSETVDVDVTVRAGSLSLTLWDGDDYKAIQFNMSDRGHRDALARLVDVIQHQLEIHREGDTHHGKES